MTSFGSKISIRTFASLFALALASSAQAQDVTEEYEDDASNIIVTATVRQGGAQDIRHFRSVSLDGSFLPQRNGLTMEGLMGEHDLTLAGERACRQMFCLTGGAMPAALPTRPEDKYFVGLGFASNIDAEKWTGTPLSLIAVVDRSGSMDGAPIATVKEALRIAAAKLRKGDRFGIVIYGDTSLVHLAPVDVEGNRDAISKAIESIEIDGATSLEEGLELGYETAFAELARSRGKTRLMLFTDENPNVGDTSAEGFMGQAENGSRRGVGLTTIGVGVHFDAALATRVSSVRGGNLFFVDPGDEQEDDEGNTVVNPARGPQSAKAVFAREFFNMVSEVGHDIAITMTPAAGYRISGVFGVPDGLMTEAPEGAVTVRIGSAFLSSNGGGIYAALAPDASRANLPARSIAAGAPLLSASLTYVDAVSGKAGSDEIAVAPPATEAPVALAKAQLLVDEYLTLTKALDLYHDDGDKKGAYHLLAGLDSRLDQTRLPGMGGERKLVGGLKDRAAYVAGYAGEAGKSGVVPRAAKPMALVGEWRVIGHQGLLDIARGDRVEITEYQEFVTHRTRGREKTISQTIEANENELRIDRERFAYSLRGGTLNLVTADGMASLRMRRVTGEGDEDPVT